MILQTISFFLSFKIDDGKLLLLFELFFCKKISLSRRVEYVVDESVSVRDVCMSHQSDRIYYKQPIKFLVLKVNGI